MDYFFEVRRKSIDMWKSNNIDFAAHLHDQIELGCCEKGSCYLYIEDKKYHINKGDFFIVFPNQIHRYEGSDEIKASILIFTPELVPEFRSVFSQKVPVSPVINKGTEQASIIIDLIIQLRKSTGTETMRGLVIALCGLLLDVIELEKVDKYNISTLKNVLIFCDEHYTEPITIDDVGKALHISRSHISHIFRDKLNSTFGRYIAAKRISVACDILKNSSKSITDAAFAAGFDSPRTFNRVFLKYMGCSPREYRKNVNNL